MKKTFVIGDIHGGYKALLQCLKRSKFNYDNDHLIVLGDICDGWPEVHLCIEELLKINRCTYILGNHDLWVLKWAKHKWQDPIWTEQGGANTIRSYNNKAMPKEHVHFLNQGLPYFEYENDLFVHGGFNPDIPLAEQDLEYFVWDRQFLMRAVKKHSDFPSYKFGGYKEIFIGHTPTLQFGSTEPLKFCNVWLLDTGAGWNGKLTMMELESHNFWQSDFVTDLYPGERGRF